MGKDKKIKKQLSSQPQELIGISRKGKKIIGAGFGVLIIGFFILTKTDPAGQNWASILSPFMILGGYGIIAIGIIFPDKNENLTHPLPKKEE